MIRKVYFVVVFGNGMIGRGEAGINLGGVLLAFLAKKGAVFGEK